MRIGDRVKVISEVGSEYIHVGSTGKIVGVHGPTHYSIHWDLTISKLTDDYATGHTCGGLCPNHHGWNVSKGCVALERPDLGKWYEQDQEGD